VEIDHFLNCMETGETPITNGDFGTDVVRAIEIAIEGVQKESFAEAKVA
jgi:hypothetical protein